MADIVQLKENGVIKYPQTHVDAVVGLKEKIEVQDTGWVNCPLQGGANGKIEARKIRDTVYLRGDWVSLNNLTNNTFCKLPVQFRPNDKQSIFGAGQTTNANGIVQLIYVTPDGDMSYVASGAKITYTSFSNVSWLKKD